MVLLLSVARQWIAGAVGRIRGRTGLVIALALGFGVLLAPDAGSAQQLRPLDGDPAAGDRYGFSVAIDGPHVLVGSPYADDYGSASGGVSSFTWSGQGWGNLQRLAAGEVGAEDQFGWDLAVDNDLAIVGTYTGAAYIFEWTDSTWTEQARLLLEGGGENDYFGQAVDISGDYAIVGASGVPVADTLNNAGAAVVFVRGSAGWLRDTTLTAPQPEAGDQFGFSVALDGARAVVGARGRDNHTGAAYVFERSAGAWNPQAMLAADQGTADDEFGFSVDISGERVLVGAWKENSEAVNAGAAYSFTRTSAGWEQERRWTAGDTSAVDAGYGFAVAIDSNVAVIGSPRGDGWVPESGVSHLYAYGDDSWQKIQTLAPDSVALFGSSVAADAVSGVLVGAWGTNNSSGSAWLRDVSPETPVTRHDPELPRRVTLGQNYPNPFNPTTTIPYRVPSVEHVRLEIYDARGRLVATPVNRMHSPGRYTVRWRARNHPSGVYFYRLTINDRSKTRSMILSK